MDCSVLNKSPYGPWLYHWEVRITALGGALPQSLLMITVASERPSL